MDTVQFNDELVDGSDALSWWFKFVYIGRLAFLWLWVVYQLFPLVKCIMHLFGLF